MCPAASGQQRRAIDHQGQCSLSLVSSVRSPSETSRDASALLGWPATCASPCCPSSLATASGDAAAP
eukprot:scaffold1282_cov251-Pinguiococcus_pyrenoidosus.AAC.42